MDKQTEFIKRLQQPFIDEIKNLADENAKLINENEHLKTEYKEHVKNHYKIQNSLLKSLDNVIEELKHFRYCKQGNENYLNDIINSVLQSEMRYLKALKEEVYKI